MRTLALLLISLPASASAADLSDVDVAAITKVSAQFLHAPPSYISPPSEGCRSTAEDGCTLEVHVVGGAYLSQLTVSKINGVWAVGRWQRETFAFGECVDALRSREAKEDALGVPVDPARRRKDLAA